MILHMLQRKDWEAAVKAGIYRPDSIANEGFIHCSEPNMITTVANGCMWG